MKDYDYGSIMQKRMAYLAKKYDPHDRYSVKEPEIRDKPVPNMHVPVLKRISTVYSTIISFLF